MFDWPGNIEGTIEITEVYGSEAAGDEVDEIEDEIMDAIGN